MEYILKNSLLRRTLDNVTVVLIAFNNFKHSVFGQGGKGNQSKEGAHNDSSVISNEQSNIKGTKSTLGGHEIRKENIPPVGSIPSQKQLNINTAGSSSAVQALKSTTHAQAVNGHSFLNSVREHNSKLQNPNSF